jgi:hypothetical protein
MTESGNNPDSTRDKRDRSSRAPGTFLDLVLVCLLVVATLISAGFLVWTIARFIWLKVLIPFDSGQIPLAPAASFEETSRRTGFVLAITAVLWFLWGIRTHSSYRRIALIVSVLAGLFLVGAFARDDRTLSIDTFICNPGTTRDQVLTEPDAHCQKAAPGELSFELRSEGRSWKMDDDPAFEGKASVRGLPAFATQAEVVAFSPAGNLINGLITNNPDRFFPVATLGVDQDPGKNFYWRGSINLRKGSTSLHAYFTRVSDSPVADATIEFEAYACPGQTMADFDASTCTPYDGAAWPVVEDNQIFSNWGTSSQRRIGWWSAPTTNRDGNRSVVTNLSSRPYRFRLSSSAIEDPLPQQRTASFIAIPAGSEQILANDLLSHTENDPMKNVLIVEISGDMPQHPTYVVYVLFHD